MPLTYPPQLEAACAAHPHPVLFATVSGAHLYGFESPDSDWDLRGVHVLPARTVVGLDPDEDDTVARGAKEPGCDLDLVTHDVKKFVGLLLTRNGYVLEQLLSPLVVRTTPEHAELQRLAGGCLTRPHAHHYLGFARTQWELHERTGELKPLLYTYRVLLTGAYLMREGAVVADLRVLNALARVPGVDELVAAKREGTEHGAVPAGLAGPHHAAAYLRLTADLEAARDASPLLAEVADDTRAALNAFLVRLRLGPWGRL